MSARPFWPKGSRGMRARFARRREIEQVSVSGTVSDVNALAGRTAAVLPESSRGQHAVSAKTFVLN